VGCVDETKSVLDEDEPMVIEDEVVEFVNGKHLSACSLNRFVPLNAL
jgi:hypothetical protein